MAEDMGEKTELPSGRRLQEARARGQVAKSTDLAAAIDLTASAVLVAVFGGFVIRVFAVVMRETFDARHGLALIQLDTALEAARGAAWKMSLAALPFLLALACVSAFSYVVQFGMLFTLQPLTPDLNRLNPVSGLGRLFSRRNAVKTLVNSVKLALVLTIAYAVLNPALPQIVGLPNLEVFAGFEMIWSLVVTLALWLLALLVVLGAADYFYQRWQHTQDLKMTKKEVTDERRSMDGDPQVKAKRFNMMRQIIFQQISANVPQADVVVTNPTHFSVAIRYDESSMAAPRVVAKGADLLAFRIRQVAAYHQVPILERPPLARALYYAVDVGGEIPPEHYQAVAEVLAYVYRLEGRAA